MAHEIEVILEPVPVGVDNFGDVVAPNLAVTFDAGLTSGLIGAAVKAGDETAGFFRFDMPAATPAESTITKIKLELTNSAAGVAGVNVRLGNIQPDTFWDGVNGFKLVSDGGDYADADALPHPTADGDDAIILGTLVLDVFISPTLTLLAADWTAGAVRTIGEGYTVDHATTNMLSSFRGLFAVGRRQFGYVLDPFNTLVEQHVTVWLGDQASAALRPKLYVTYEPPDRTRVVTVGASSQSGVAIAARAALTPAVQSAASGQLVAAISAAARSSSSPAVRVAAGDVESAVNSAGYTLEED